jgi:hypothetical protein
LKGQAGFRRDAEAAILFQPFAPACEFDLGQRRGAANSNAYTHRRALMST